MCVFFVSLAGWGGGGGEGVVFVHDFFGGKGKGKCTYINKC